MKRRRGLRCGCAGLSLALMLQLGAVPAYAAADPADEAQSIATVNQSDWDRLAEELSQNGNPVTRYINQDDQKEKTIIWTRGITPPTIGNDDSDFKRGEYSANGTVTDITYVAPYQANRGWYDVNKSGGADANLCFAAAASNSLHWWLDQNEKYIQQYLKKHPDDAEVQKVKNFCNSFQGQQDSELFRYFINTFGDRTKGYWPDLLEDKFINGYPYKKNEGVNDPEFDGPQLIEKGPEKNSGFFFKVFSSQKLSSRRYDGQYDLISKNIKDLLMNGNLVMLSYGMGGRVSHVVTLWGAEYDLNGKISAVYLSDSDDPQEYGMVRYRVVRSGMNTLVTTSVNETHGSQVEALISLSLGEDIWEQYLGITKEPLTLTWGNTNFVYNGLPQKPDVTCSGVLDGDTVEVISVGAQTNAGKHTATASLQGADSDKYEIINRTQSFTIRPADVQIEVTLNLDEYAATNNVVLLAEISGVQGEKPSGKISLFDENNDRIGIAEVINGTAEISWNNPAPGKHAITANFEPAKQGVGKNYAWTTRENIPVEFHKKEQSPLVFEPVGDKRFGESDFRLSATGGSSSGEIVYSSDRPDVITVNGDMATITGVGTAILTATRLWDTEYDSVSATITVNVARGQAPNITYPAASGLTYGQTLADSSLTGGSSHLGSFAWEDSTVVPDAGSTQQRVKFIPNSTTEQNYEPVASPIGEVTVTVSKATPPVSVSASVTNNGTAATAVLTAMVDKVGQGAVPEDGTVKFVDCTSGADVDIPGAGAVAVQNGTATFTWTGMQQGRYKIKAEYSGNANYTEAASSAKTIDVTVYPQGTYSIIVEDDGNGAASASHTAASKGTRVTLTATPNEGYRFKTWKVLEGQVSVSGNAFVMPDMPVSLQAVFEKKEDSSGGSGDSGGSNGGGGGGGSAVRPEKPGIVKNPDGSTTETVIQSDGTVVKTTTKTDGSSVIETQEKNGASSTTQVSPSGAVETQVKIPERVSVEAKETNQPVALPMPPAAVQNAAGKAPVVEVDLGSQKNVPVLLPVRAVTPGMVAVVVREDGTREVVCKSVVTDSQLLLTLDGSATLEVEDRSKDFADAQNHWAKDAIDFVTSREIYHGTSATTFSPDASITRSMLVKILHNLENNPKREGVSQFSDVDSNAWFADAVQWAVDSGIVVGIGNNQFAPDRVLTRENIAVMLHRYAGKPEPSGKELRFQDADQVGSHADEAIRWAVEKGIMNGTAEGSLNPKGTATRAQTAVMLMRLMNTIMG